MRAGRALQPWQMDAAVLKRESVKPAPRAWVSEMARFARQAGWHELADHMVTGTCEQEGLEIVLPRHGSGTRLIDTQG